MALAPSVQADIADYTYVTNGLEITITGYDCGVSNSVAAIPDSINGLPVTRIGNRAFRLCGSLISVTIPDNVALIGDEAFQGCAALTSVIMGSGVTNIEGFAFSSCYALTNVAIGSSVTRIGNSAFNSCDALTSITIPVSVTDIGGLAFSACNSLTSIHVTPGNLVYSDLDGVLFNLDQTVLIGYPAGLAGTYSIPSSVTTIEPWAFARSPSLTGVTIPDGVTAIGERAFAECFSLLSITVAGGNLSYSDQNGVLFNLDQTSLVAYPAGLAGSYTIPSSVTTIEPYAFAGCLSLTGVAIPDGVSSIPKGAFFSCSALTSVVIPDGVTTIGDFAFITCRSLTSVSIPGSVTTIGHLAFYGCDALGSVFIPDSVTSIGPYAFRSCDALASIYFAGDAPTIGPSAFSSSPSTIYYLAGTAGWGETFGGRPTAVYTWPQLMDISPRNPLTLNLAGDTNMTVAVEACTNLVNPVWVDVGTAVLIGGTNTITDGDWTNHPSRMYRVLPR